MLSDVEFDTLFQETPKRSRKLLVVEDEAVVALDLAEQLGGMGYTVCGIADNGAEAEALVEQHRPELVLMDISIKGPQDGIDTAARLVQRFQTPVVFLTAYSDERTVQRAAKAMPYGYLTKPYQAKELRAALEVALYKSSLERRLRESERWFAATLRCVADAVLAVDPQERIRFMNPAAEALLGVSLEQARGGVLGACLSLEAPDSDEGLASLVASLLRGGASAGISFGHTLVTATGRRLPVDQSAAPIRGYAGQILGVVLALRDVSQRLAAEMALRDSEERFRTAFDFAPVGMALVSLDGRFLQGNAAMAGLLRCTGQELTALTLDQVTHEDDRANEQQQLRNLFIEEIPSLQYEKRLLTLQGDAVWTLTSVSLLQSPQGPVCYLFQVHDLRERKEAEYKLELLAHSDPLTGLANRARLRDETERQILYARRHQQKFAMVFLDLDHFKQVNDRLGHETGDRLLRLVADRLRAAVRESDCVARLGGDEFVILLKDIEDLSSITAVTDKLMGQFADEIALGPAQQRVGLSIGVALFPENGGDARTLLQCADSALYQAKAEGRNNVQFYSPALTERLNRRLALDEDLHAAIARGEFELHYQPIVPLAPGAPLRTEALIRWRHPGRGLLLPGDFLEHAEETGQIETIGAWVLHQACADAMCWPAGPAGPIGVAVNVSLRQFKSGALPGLVAEALRESGLAPERLCLELTERLMLQDGVQNLGAIQELKALGVEIALDDFGVGFSKLSHIRRFGLHKLKIDRSFVARLGLSADDDAMILTIVALARSLHLVLVAEGVENQAQLDFLRQQGCDFIQGYYFAQPLPLPELQGWLAASRAG